MYEYMQKKSGDKKQNSQQMNQPIVQRLRLRLNDNKGEDDQFERLRQVPVSAPNYTAVSNTPASNKLQKHYTPDVKGATFWETLSSSFGRQCSDYGPPGTVNTLHVNEDIILEGHGSDVGMEDYSPKEMAEIAKKIIHTCGYGGGNRWQGKLVLLGCATGRYTQETATRLRAEVGFPVTVVGTERNIRVNNEAGGAHYAEEDWAGRDAGAPTNLAEIVAFDDFLNHTLFPATEQIESMLRKYIQLILNELLAKISSRAASTAPVSPQFMTQFHLINGQFANVRMNFAGIAVPVQPADIQFPAGRLPAIQTHYTQAAVGDNIPVAPGLNANMIKINVINSLNALDTAYRQSVTNGCTIQKLNTFCTVFNQEFDNITNECGKLLPLMSEFRRARSRRIDFNNPNDIQSFTAP